MRFESLYFSDRSRVRALFPRGAAGVFFQLFHHRLRRARHPVGSGERFSRTNRFEGLHGLASRPLRCVSMIWSASPPAATQAFGTTGVGLDVRFRSFCARRSSATSSRFLRPARNPGGRSKRTPNHALQRTAPRVTVAAFSSLDPSSPSHLWP